ncbi:hypothetical protein ACFV1L_19560 [Kitasatospora sp. NPDC059646]|uniref:hypothetical protein n=1 Tax=Kitasatospora sp. NPDC059646 TaxID=3346893 RepID=UPI00368471F4
MRHLRPTLRTACAVALSSGLALAAPAAGTARTLPSVVQAADGTLLFAFTGAPESVTVPEDVCRATVTAFGAAGGDAVYGSSGGLGGEVHATLDVHSGQVLTVNVAGAGSGGSLSDGSRPHGGYGGGGQGGAYNNDPSPGNGAVAAGGGGATTVALDGAAVIVAGGGGGGAGSFADNGTGRGGDGGRTGESGQTPGTPGSGQGGASGGDGGAGGAGGTPAFAGDQPGVAGGSANGMTGGNGALNVGDPHMGTGGGGGGGAHGGGAGGSSTGGTLDGGGGGGGSSLGPAGAQFTTGIRSGNGEVQLAWAPCGPSPTPTPTPTPTAPEPTPTGEPPTAPEPSGHPTHPALPETGAAGAGPLTALAALTAAGGGALLHFRLRRTRRRH